MRHREANSRISEGEVQPRYRKEAKYSAGLMKLGPDNDEGGDFQNGPERGYIAVRNEAESLVIFEGLAEWRRLRPDGITGGNPCIQRDLCGIRRKVRQSCGVGSGSNSNNTGTSTKGVGTLRLASRSRTATKVSRTRV